MHVFLAFLGAYMLLCLAAYLFQGRLVWYPSSRLEHDPSRVGLDFEDAAISAPDGAALHGWFVPGPEPGAPVVLFCHGNAGNVSHRLDTLRIVHGLGLAVLIFDYRGYGRSTGRVSEQGTYLDAGAAWDWLAAKGYSPERIVVWGRSLGGPIAARLAAERKPAACVLESTFTTAPDVGARAYFFLPVRMLARIHYPTVEYVAGLACPLLVVHSREDEMIPFAMGVDVYAAAPEPKRFLEISGEHNDGFLESEHKYAHGLKGFLREIFPK